MNRPPLRYTKNPGPIKSLRYLARSLSSLIRAETAAPVPMPFDERLWLWRQGFVSKTGRVCGITPDNAQDYLSDLALHLRCWHLNGHYVFILADKSIAANFMDGLAPTNHARWSKGEVIPLEARGVASLDALRALCSGLKIVIKPTHGFKGRDVTIVDDTQTPTLFNGVPGGELGAFLQNIDEDVLISEFIEQGDYAAAVFPDATNTIRVLTLWDFDAQTPFIAGAAHRFGTRRTAPVDNWARGGLSAHIDLETGVLGHAARMTSDHRLIWDASHPDTRARIEGIEVPGWDDLKRGVLRLARNTPFLPLIGWDIVATNDGFRVIEGNPIAGVQTLQVHKPLLSDPRIRRAFEARLTSL